LSAKLANSLSGVNQFPNVKRWYVTIAKRAPVRKGYDVPKKVQDIPIPK